MVYRGKKERKNGNMKTKAATHQLFGQEDGKTKKNMQQETQLFSQFKENGE